MNYQACYDRLIYRAQWRILDKNIYCEKHHILPRCLGGKDNCLNLVKLTAEEHFVAHILLSRLHPKNHKLIFAIKAMTINKNGKRSNNKMYGWIRKKFAEAVSEKMKGLKRSPESILKSSIARTGSKRSKETKFNIGITSKRPDRVAALIERNKSYIGREVSQETKEKLRLTSTGRKMPPKTIESLASFSLKMKGRKRPLRSLEWCANIGLANKGKKLSDETKCKISEGLKGHVISDACKEKLSLLNKGKKIKEPRSKEWREKMSAAKTGRKLSEETKLRMKESQIVRWAAKKALAGEV